MVNGPGRNDQLTSVIDDPVPMCPPRQLTPHLIDITPRTTLLFVQRMQQMGGLAIPQRVVSLNDTFPPREATTVAG